MEDAAAVDDDAKCAICLQSIELAKTAIIKGCSHSYCIACILTWASYKESAAWCPQCKVPFSYLYTYLCLDGELMDEMQPEPVVLLLRACWFTPTSLTQIRVADEHEDESYWDEGDEYDDDSKYHPSASNRRAAGNGALGGGPAGGLKTAATKGMGRRAARSARRRAQDAGVATMTKKRGQRAVVLPANGQLPSMARSHSFPANSSTSSSVPPALGGGAARAKAPTPQPSPQPSPSASGNHVTATPAAAVAVVESPVAAASSPAPEASQLAADSPVLARHSSAPAPPQNLSPAKAKRLAKAKAKEDKEAAKRAANKNKRERDVAKVLDRKKQYASERQQQLLDAKQAEVPSPSPSPVQKDSLGEADEGDDTGPGDESPLGGGRLDEEEEAPACPAGVKQDLQRPAASLVA